MVAFYDACSNRTSVIVRSPVCRKHLAKIEIGWLVGLRFFKSSISDI